MSCEVIDFIFHLEEGDEVYMHICKTTHTQQLAEVAQDTTV
jgi:hypothetical protein